MLEGLLKQALHDKPVQIESAGTSEEEGQPAHEYSIACMDEHGIDIRAHKSRSVRKIDLAQFDLIICMEPQHAEEVRRLAVGEAVVVVANPPNGVENPWEKGPEAYKASIKTMEKVTADTVSSYFS